MTKTTKKPKRKYMPRLPRDEVALREDFMKNMFRKDPEMSQPKATAEFAAQFGSKMRPQRVYALRKLVRDALAVEAVGGQRTAPPSLSRSPAVGGAGAMTLVTVPDGSELLACEIVTKLAGAGIVRGTVKGSGVGYVVIEMK